MEKHEFWVAICLKLCLFLGCKWGVPLVIYGGGISGGGVKKGSFLGVFRGFKGFGSFLGHFGG